MHHCNFQECALGEHAWEAEQRFRDTTRCVLIGSHLGARAHGAVGTEPAIRTAA